jgi:DNA-binding transcriptional MocR family regulator
MIATCKMRLALSRQVVVTAQKVVDYFPKGTKISKPSGGYVVWVELPKKLRAMELQRLAIKNNVDFAPGPLFSSRGDYKNYIRISCNNLWSNRIDQALRRLGDLCIALS